MTDTLLAIIGYRPLSLVAIITALRDMDVPAGEPNVRDALGECVDRQWLKTDGKHWRAA